TGYVQLATQGETFELLGIDPFSEQPFRDHGSSLEQPADMEALITKPGATLLAEDTAHRLGLRRGDRLTLSIDGVSQALTVVGLIKQDNELTRRAMDSIIITDISTAQELLNLIGRLSRIDVIVSEDDTDAQIQQIREILPSETDIVPSDARSSSQQQMTRAFELNLTALSLLALVVGMFLIYNSMTISVVQRNCQIGLLRALGVTRRQVGSLIFTEAVVLAFIATGLGLYLGWLLAHSLLELVTRTINDLYFALEVRNVTVTASSLLKSMLLGVGATLVACAIPAWESMRLDIVSVLRRSQVEYLVRGRLRWLSLAGVLLLLSGALVLLAPTRALVPGFAGLFLLILGTALLAPSFTVWLFAVMARPFGRIVGMLGHMALRGVVASLSRTGVAVAALAVALSTVVGVGIMIGSFRLSVEHWLENYLRADIYLSIPEQRPNSTLKLEVIDVVKSTGGVETLSVGRWTSLPGASGDTDLLVLSVSESGFMGFRFKEGDPKSAWAQFRNGDAVIVSEPYAYHHDLAIGDHITLRTDAGKHEFPVAGIFYHYGSDQGIVVMNRGTYLRLWNDDRITSIGIYTSPQTDVIGLQNELKKELSPVQPLIIRSNRQLREASLQVFDRTFVITDVLRLVAIFVAVVGILSALMTIQLERAREFAVLRAQGLTPRQLWGLICAESGLIGFAAGLLAIPLGVITALVLIVIINRRSFGWTMQVNIDPMVLVNALLLAVGVAVVAGIYPALKMAYAAPARALRAE
ncbi:MAG: ABC transporter permease, partial [Gammaproteobacteria bacterium]|nr:ABC transporter permease [Gammaproteobacteria bacterium]